MNRPITAAARSVAPPGIAGYEYGNARLRARRAGLLDRSSYRELHAAGSPERMLGVLRETPYGPDVERATGRRDALDGLDATVRHHLARSLRDLRRFYSGRAAEGVELLLGRWDLRNLIAVVRAAARPVPAQAIESMVVPAGRLDSVALAELARQPSLRSTVDLMVAWDVPSRTIARRVLRAWPRYEESGDPVVLETELARAWADAVAHALDDWRGTDLDVVLRAEIDQLNVLGALRRRESGPVIASAADGASEDTDLPGGAIGRSVLDRVRGAPDAAAALAVLDAQSLPGGWHAALARWGGDRDLGALTSRLERAIAVTATGRSVRGDQLGISIPIAFVWAKESEARNVRLVARAVVHRLDWLEIEAELWP